METVEDHKYFIMSDTRIKFRHYHSTGVQDPLCLVSTGGVANIIEHFVMAFGSHKHLAAGSATLIICTRRRVVFLILITIN
jgi:hypothetical protein